MHHRNPQHGSDAWKLHTTKLAAILLLLHHIQRTQDITSRSARSNPKPALRAFSVHVRGAAATATSLSVPAHQTATLHCITCHYSTAQSSACIAQQPPPPQKKHTTPLLWRFSSIGLVPEPAFLL
jgi:hypothetical protein